MYWLLLMAWRDSRRNKFRLFLFISSIMLGVAALVAINSFGLSLRLAIDKEAKSLVGADLVVDSKQKSSPELEGALSGFEKKATKTAKEINFASMVLFPKNNGTRLAQIRGLEGDFPFYGQIETNPANARKVFSKDRRALVDKTLLLQFNIKVGDSIKVGQIMFQVAGELLKVPGQSGIAATVAPTVYIPMQFIEETGLLQKGSRIAYLFYFKFPDTQNIAELVSPYKMGFEKENIRYSTSESTKQNFGRGFEYLTRFLNLVAFIALLLGCVGVASAVHIYIKDKLSTVAVLRCLGLSGQQAFMIYLIQISLMGLLGSLLGALFGSVLQFLLPQVLKGFLPVDVEFVLSWSAILQGILTGLGISILFALVPLLAVRRISPLRTLRVSFEEAQSGVDFWRWVIYVMIFCFVTIFAYQQVPLIEALIFSGSILLAFLILALVAATIMYLVRRFFPTNWSYIWRQSLSNLYRPQNQTLILMVSIGLGTALLSTLYLVQGVLLSQVSFADRGNQPNMILFDIQSNQKESIRKFTEDFKLPVLQQVPIVTMRLDEFKGVSRVTLLNDSNKTTRLPNDIINREYRVSYRDTLNNSEALLSGKLQKGYKGNGDSIWISMDEFHANRMKAKIGDEIVFDVQGRKLKTYVGSLRKVTLNRIETSFTIIFPTGVLEEAPQFYVLITRVDSKEKSAQFQQAIVKQYPNVSLVDLTMIIKTADEILGQISFVIQFMSLFSILTGLIVLIGSIILSRYQRIQESVLLRTLGASRNQMLQINTLEYFFLGSLASLTGILLAIVGAYGLSRFSFEIPFTIQWLPIIVLYLIITSLTVIIGLLNSQGILNKSPLEVLRAEV